VDGTFSWVDDGSWDVSVDFQSDALVSAILMKHPTLGIELTSRDFVDSELDVFCRQLKVKNTSNAAHEIRIFMHQVFQISRAGRADTALFVPDTNYILDYKGNCSLLIYGQDEHDNHFDQFAIGNYGIEGKEGTFRDAEDGELSGSAVEHGGVDSVMRFSCPLAGNDETTIDYWIAAADSQFTAEHMHETILKDGLIGRLEKTTQYWHEWFSIASNPLHRINREHLDLVKKSLMIIKAHTDKNGGIIASCDSSIYNYGRDYYSYVWPRDGAYALWPLIRMGFTEEAKNFFEFCTSILSKDGYLMHKYQPDRAIGSTWHPLLHGDHKELAIQEDETASVLYMIGEYLHYSDDEEYVESLYDRFVKPAANFMAHFMDEHTGLPHASYDLWERKFLTSTYTVSTVYQALLTAADIAKRFKHRQDEAYWERTAQSIEKNSQIFFNPERSSLRNGFLLQQDGSLQFDNTLDLSSMYAALTYGMFDGTPELLQQTVQVIENEFLDQTPSGGTPRFENDEYFRADPVSTGNPWIICTLWLAQYYERKGNYSEADRMLAWAVSTAGPSGVLSEQVDPNDKHQVSVSPLVWSHAELVNTILDVANRK
jgi:GH15 family glucan-1,4-alpha-glucosidase